jgi:hypothetical protein
MTLLENPDAAPVARISLADNPRRNPLSRADPTNIDLEIEINMIPVFPT